MRGPEAADGKRQSSGLQPILYICMAAPLTGCPVNSAIYTHEDRQAHRDALARISEALGHGDELPPADEADG